jgi:hypothetical protein
MVISDRDERIADLSLTAAAGTVTQLHSGTHLETQVEEAGLCEGRQEDASWRKACDDPFHMLRGFFCS